MSSMSQSTQFDWFVANGMDLSNVPSYVPDSAFSKLPRLEVYVDETGDRNFKANRQSDWFAMTAVMVPVEYVPHVNAVIRGLQHQLKVPAGRPLHWVEHCRKKSPERRKIVLDLLTGFLKLRVIHVAIHKPSIGQMAHMRRDSRGVYHWATNLLVERIGEVAARWDGGPRRARINFGVVGGFDHGKTMSYLNLRANDARAAGADHAYDYLQWPFKWFEMGRYEGLELADAYSGFLTTAINESSHEFICRYARRIPVSRTGRPHGWGFKVFPDSGWQYIRNTAWWDEVELII